jgi:hypothetical protein
VLVILHHLLWAMMGSLFVSLKETPWLEQYPTWIRSREKIFETTYPSIEVRMMGKREAENLMTEVFPLFVAKTDFCVGVARVAVDGTVSIKFYQPQTSQRLNSILTDGLWFSTNDSDPDGTHAKQ